MIDLCNDVEQVIDEMLQCECTMSSSLHGLIVSHAYNINSCWIRLSEKIAGGFTKYHDYYKSVGIMSDLKPIYIKTFIELSELVDTVKNYPNPSFPIDVNHIMDVCPFNSQTSDIL